MKRLTLQIATLLLLLLTTAGWSEPAGLLLGFRRSKPTPHNPEAYSPERAFDYFTVWIYPQQGGYRHALGPDLLVPRSDGFWKAGVIRQNEPNWVEDHLFAYPLGQPKKPEMGPPWGTEGHTSNEITYVGPKGMSVLTHSGGYTEGAAHPWNNWTLETRDLDKVNRSVRIQSVWGREGWQQLKKGAEEYMEAHPKKIGILRSLPRENAWGVVRKPGRWEVEGLLSHDNEVYRGSHAVFPVNLPIPKTISAHDRLSFGMTALRAKVPGAVDAFQAPGGSPLVVLTKDYIHVYDGWPSMNPELTIDLTAPSQPIMAEWALGDYVPKWTQTVMDFVGADI